MSNNTPDVPVTALETKSNLTEIETASANLSVVAMSLSTEIKNKLTAILNRVMPNKKGMEEVVAEFQLPTIRVRQPVTSSEACPDTAKAGDLYTTSGQLMPRELVLTPIKFFERNDRFETGTQKLVCSAPDAKLGNPLGWCVNPKTKEECPYLPMGKNSDGRKTDCTNSLVILAVDKDLTGIYQIQFSKTSRRAGSALQRLAGAGQTVWDNWYKLTTEKQTGGQGVYYTLKVAPTGEKVDQEIAKVCDALCDLSTAHRRSFIDGYYARRQGAADAAKAAEAVDEKALMEGLQGNSGEEPEFEPTTPATTKKKKDFSKSM